MPQTRRMVIVGGGLAGAKAAEAIRDGGFDGEVVILAAESEPPYERPDLSKGYLTGGKERGDLAVHPRDWYSAQEVVVRAGAEVDAVDRSAKEVVLTTGERMAYHRVLLATGATPVVPDLPGADGARYLRRLDDSEGLRAEFTDGRQVVVVGAGWIGLEVAAAARGAGCEVTVVEPRPTPLHGVLGPEVGDLFARVHRDHGVRLLTGTGVSAIEDDGVVTDDDGRRLPADVVVVGVGARPLDGLARAAGLAVSDGVEVDEMLATSDPDIFAAGDVAAAHHPGIGRRIRVEHWANALNQGKAAGAAMIGRGTPYDRVPYFYSDQFDLGMEYSGHVGPDGYDRVVFRGDPDGGEYIAFWLRGDRVLAGMNVNVWDVTDPIQALVRAGWRGTGVDVGRLTDPDVLLTDLAPAPD